MFKSIFLRLLVIFISILLFAFILTGGILYFTLGTFLTKEKVNLLERNGLYVIDNLTYYMGNTETHQSIQRTINSFSLITDSMIWVVGSKGEIYYNSNIPELIKDNLNYNYSYYSLPKKEQYQNIMESEKPIELKGDFYGLFKDYNYPWITIEIPFKYEGEIIGAVYLHAPTSELERTRTSVFQYFFFAVGISIVLSTLLIYVFSKRITRPLKEIKQAARIIAGGEFQNRLDIKSKDEIGELAESFNNMAGALENLEEMRRGFIANVSHELRTPMTSIRGFIEGILDGTIPPERQKDYLSIVRDETGRLNRLVNNLLDLARMESGEMKIIFRVFDINELIRRCIIKLEKQIIEKNLEIEAHFEEEEMLVFADPDAIDRVLFNLIHNAVKFTGINGNITLRTEYQRNKVLVTVQDNGVGIEKDEVDRIWERFYKSDKSRSYDKTGTGLGLAIIKNIISEHQQQIWVESVSQIGTKFFFTLEKYHPQ